MNGEALSLPSWPQGMVELTAAQVAAVQQQIAQGYTWNGSGYVAPPPPTLAEAQAAQGMLIQNAAAVSETAAQSFTTSAGVASTYPMDPGSWIKYLGSYTHYVVYAQPLPSGFSFYDTSGKAVPFVVADIKAFFSAGLSQIETALAKQASLLAQIEAAVTVAEVNAVVW